jgi:hypothetical protein
MVKSKWLTIGRRDAKDGEDYAQGVSPISINVNRD